MDLTPEPKLLTSDPAQVDRAASERAVKVRLPGRSLVAVGGEERLDFLHRICSQDIHGMGEGEGRPATLLDGKAKVKAIVVAWKLAGRVLLEVDREQAPAVLQLLDLFLFREKVILTDLGAETSAVAVLGPDAPAVVRSAAGSEVAVSGRGAVLTEAPLAVLLPAVRLGRPGFVLHAPEPEAERFFAASGPIPVAGSADLERWRIRAGVPAFGRDTDERTIPLEANLDDAVSVTKGCYVGQEVIARIHTYGHVNRHLVVLELPGLDVPAPGTPLFAEGGPVGRITSAAADPMSGRVIALGFVPRALRAAGERFAVGKDGPPEATIVEPEQLEKLS